MTQIKRALISVYDKTNLLDFARELIQYDVKIFSTGGSAKALKEANIPVEDVSSYTGFPEIMNGRVKTLHPKIHGAILGKQDDPQHQQQMAEHQIEPFDLVVVNLYPFEKVVSQKADDDVCIENIDIGGPTMIRAAAKNHAYITTIVDPQDYDLILKELTNHQGKIASQIRKDLASKAFSLTASYDSAISQWFHEKNQCIFPKTLTLHADLQQTLRYGENPHQQSAVYRMRSQQPSIANSALLQGKELSFNNLNDSENAFNLVSEFSQPSVAIIKHSNPCGVATAPTLKQAYLNALSCDPTSAFGGIIALNQPLDVETTTHIIDLFSEVIIAPKIEPKALEILKKKKNVRVMQTNEMAHLSENHMSLRSLNAGLLLQTSDTAMIEEKDLQVVTKRQPTQKELDDLLFAIRVCKHTSSNAIVYVKDLQTIGIGAGQMSRLDSCRIAAWKAEEFHEKSNKSIDQFAVASDAFFPFADGLLTAIKAGASAFIQPGGSIKDQEVIDAANEHNVAMVLTHLRHFKH